MSNSEILSKAMVDVKEAAFINSSSFSFSAAAVRKKHPFLPLSPEDHLSDGRVDQKIATACWWHHSWIHFVLFLQTVHCSANIAFSHYPVEIMVSEVSCQYMPFPPFHSLICPRTSGFLQCENVIFTLCFQVGSVQVCQNKSCCLSISALQCLNIPWIHKERISIQKDFMPITFWIYF